MKDKGEITLKLTRRQITLKVLSNFINSNLDKINDVEMKANNITFMTNSGKINIKIKTSKDYTENEENKHCLWVSFSKEELENSEDNDYFVVICSDNLEKSLVFTRNELVAHFSDISKRKKNDEIDYDMYPHFIGRNCVDSRVKSDATPIDITKNLNNYVF